MFPLSVRLPLCALALSAGCHGASSSASNDPALSCDCPLDWTIDNTKLCVAEQTTYSPPIIFSSYLVDGQITCDATKRFPQPVPANAWSAQRISAGCTGAGVLHLRVRQGRADSPSPEDCVLAEQTLDFDYPRADQSLELAAAAAWSAQDEACARAFDDQGGYLELRLESDTLGCGEPDAKVNYVSICPRACSADPQREGCEACERPPFANRL